MKILVGFPSFHSEGTSVSMIVMWIPQLLLLVLLLLAVLLSFFSFLLLSPPFFFFLPFIGCCESDGCRQMFAVYFDLKLYQGSEKQEGREAEVSTQNLFWPKSWFIKQRSNLTSKKSQYYMIYIITIITNNDRVGLYNQYKHPTFYTNLPYVFVLKPAVEEKTWEETPREGAQKGQRISGGRRGEARKTGWSFCEKNLFNTQFPTPNFQPFQTTNLVLILYICCFICFLKKYNRVSFWEGNFKTIESFDFCVLLIAGRDSSQAAAEAAASEKAMMLEQQEA